MKTIEVLLHNDNADGIVEYIMNPHNIIGYKFRRDQLKIVSKELESINNAGVYLLFGDNNEVYIGEGSEIKDGVFGRLRSHNTDKKKNWWIDTVVFISANNYLGATHVKHLEKLIYDDIKDIGRFKIMNDNTPRGQKVTKKEDVDSKEFMNNIKSIVSLIGYRVFDKITKKSDIDEESVLYLKYKGEVVASGAITNDGFTIFEGSKIACKISPKATKSIAVYIEKERASEDIKNGIFIKDHPVSSPTAAGVVILGINTNGREKWKNKEGKSINDLA